MVKHRMDVASVVGKLLERLHDEIKRRTHVVGILLPNRATLLIAPF